MWQLIPGGPHIEDLRSDDIVFNVEQTNDLLRTGKTAQSGHLVAHSKGTADGMPAYKTGKNKGKLGSKTTKKNNPKGGGNGGNGGNGGKGNTNKGNNKNQENKQNDFEKYIEKLFDWIEVRLDRIQRNIDRATQNAENAVGTIDTALSNIAAKNMNLDTAIAETRSLISANSQGATKYAQQADEVLTQALNTKITTGTGKKKKQKQLIDNALAAEIKARVADGTIDIIKYSKEVQTVINEYKEWIDKSKDCSDEIGKLQAQLKELQQTKLDNITEQFEAWAGFFESVKGSSEATVELLKSRGYAVKTDENGNVDQNGQIYKAMQDQLNRQREMSDQYLLEREMLKAQEADVASIFGRNSIEYKNYQKSIEESNKTYLESLKIEEDLEEALFDLESTIRHNLIDKIKTLVNKLSSLAALDEKRGTNTKYAYKLDESSYTGQIDYNKQIIDLYKKDIDNKIAKIQSEGWEVNSDQYNEIYKQIMEDEDAVISLLSSNEDLKESIRTMRWKPYEEFQKRVDQISSDLNHLNGFIREGELMDDHGQFTERGYAQIAIFAEQMDLAEQKITNAKEAMKLLDEEVANGTISQEKYDEEIQNQIDIIQNASESMFDYQQKLADMYIDQITTENDLLQELIDKRKEALASKKA